MPGAITPASLTTGVPNGPLVKNNLVELDTQHPLATSLLTGVVGGHSKELKSGVLLNPYGGTYADRGIQHFDGVDDYIKVPQYTPSSYNATMVLKFTHVNDTYQSIFSSNTSDAGETGTGGGLSTGGVVYFSLLDGDVGGGPGSRRTGATPADISLGDTVTVVMVLTKVQGEQGQDIVGYAFRDGKPIDVTMSGSGDLASFTPSTSAESLVGAAYTVGAQYNGNMDLHFFALFDGDVGEHAARSLSENPYQILRSVDNDEYFFENKIIFVDLLADDIASSSTVATPQLGQVHAFSADGLTNSSTVGTSNLGQIHAVATTGLVSTTTTGSPVFGQVHSLSPDGVLTTTTVGSPSLSQEHGFVAGALTASTTVGSPSVGQVYPFTAEALTASSTVDSPVLGQAYILSADGLSVTSKVGRPGLDKVAVPALDIDRITLTSNTNKYTLLRSR